MSDYGKRLVIGWLLCMASGLAQAACPPAGMDRAALNRLKADGFRVADPERRERLLLDMVDCLGDPDPAVRDGIAYEAFVQWLRGDVDAATLRRLLTALYRALDAPDAEGLHASFAALVLSEVARTDHVRPWMTMEDREAMVLRAADHLQRVRDYRGFTADVGWRHGVAHGADWVAELGRNPALTGDQVQRLLRALATQVVPETPHAYIHGESTRLAVAALAVAGTHSLSRKDWQAWLQTLASRLGPPPADAMDADWLARRHDLGVFLMTLYVGADNDPSAEVRMLVPSIRQSIAGLP